MFQIPSITKQPGFHGSETRDLPVAEGNVTGVIKNCSVGKEEECDYRNINHLHEG